MNEATIEDSFIRKLNHNGTKTVDVTTYDALKENWTSHVCRINADALIRAKGKIELSPAECDRLHNRLASLTVSQAAGIWQFGATLTLDNGEDVNLVFFRDGQNRFEVTHQLKIKTGDGIGVTKNCRFDVIILLNGLPYVHVELKKPGQKRLDEAIHQLNRYRRSSLCGLLAFTRIFVVSDDQRSKYASNQDMYVNGEKNNILPEDFSFWKDENNERIHRLSDFADTFLSDKVLTHLFHYGFIVLEDKILLARSYQYHAAGLAYERIKNHDNGYIFHTTGVGKTVTGYMLANMCKGNPEIDKTIICVDRTDLDKQTYSEYNKFAKNFVVAINNTDDLIKSLKNDSCRVIVTTIQKLHNATKIKKLAIRDKRVVLIFDECHRTQFGKMHADISRYFKNYCKIGMTGTPIFPEEEYDDKCTTDILFKSRYENTPACIHRYSIEAALHDNNVLPIHVEYCQPQIQVQADALPSPRSRAKFIFDHLERNTTLGKEDNLYGHQMNCMYIAPNIRTLIDVIRAFYELDRERKYYAASLFSLVQNSFSESDSENRLSYQEEFDELLALYNEMMGTHLKKYEEYKTDVINRLKHKKSGHQIDLIFVCDMLRTGFDSKHLSTIFLDRKLKNSELLQAISRVNRPWNEKKCYGYIVSMMDLKEDIENTIRLYSENNSLESLYKSYDEQFALYRSKAEDIRSICKKPDDAAEIRSESLQKDLISLVKDANRIFDDLQKYEEYDEKKVRQILGKQELDEYSSWISEYEEEGQRRNCKEKEFVDVTYRKVEDFIINNDYILNLLKCFEKGDEEGAKKNMSQAIESIRNRDIDKKKLDEECKGFITILFQKYLDSKNRTKEAFAEECQKEVDSQYLQIAKMFQMEESEIRYLFDKNLKNFQQLNPREINELFFGRNLPFDEYIEQRKKIEHIEVFIQILFKIIHTRPKDKA